MFIIMIVCSLWSFGVEANLFFFFLSFVYICIADGNPIIESGGWNHPINRFNPTTFVCLSQATTLISNVICRGILCVDISEVKSDCPFC